MAEAYAVNLADVTQDTILLQCLLNHFLTEEIVRVEPTIDGAGVLLKGESERIRAAIDVVRIKYHKNRYRFYYSKTGKGGWKRV